MTDWSEIFEKRLQTVLQNERKPEPRAAASFDLTTPPSPTHRGLRHPMHLPTDPTSAFFESLRRQSGGGHGRRRSDSGGPVLPPAAQTTAASPVSDVDTEESITRLQKSYSVRARDLHGEAMQQLDRVQADLEAELAGMAQQAGAFVSAAAAKQALFRRPVEDWVVTIQKTGDTTITNSAAAATTTTQKDERVADRIAAMRAAADTLRSDVARLWEQWHAAQQEADAVLQAMLAGGGGSSGSGSATAATAAEDDSVDAIMAKAEKELDAAAAEAMREMKENEKTFKKLIYAEECKIAQTMLSRQSKYD